MQPFGVYHTNDVRAVIVHTLVTQGCGREASAAALDLSDQLQPYTWCQPVTSAEWQMAGRGSNGSDVDGSIHGAMQRQLREQQTEIASLHSQLEAAQRAESKAAAEVCAIRQASHQALADAKLEREEVEQHAMIQAANLVATSRTAQEEQDAIRDELLAVRTKLVVVEHIRDNEESELRRARKDLKDAHARLAKVDGEATSFASEADQTQKHLGAKIEALQQELAQARAQTGIGNTGAHTTVVTDAAKPVGSPFVGLAEKLTSGVKVRALRRNCSDASTVASSPEEAASESLEPHALHFGAELEALTSVKQAVGLGESSSSCMTTASDQQPNGPQPSDSMANIAAGSIGYASHQQDCPWQLDGSDTKESASAGSSGRVLELPCHVEAEGPSSKATDCTDVDALNNSGISVFETNQRRIHEVLMDSTLTVEEQRRNIFAMFPK